MTDSEFEALVARLDRQAQHNPAAYRVRVILLALTGYGYVLLVLTVAGGLFIGSIATLPYLKAAAVKLALVFGGFFWLVASAMWVRLDPPQGRRVTRHDAPELFNMIDSLRRSLRAPRFHDVLITEDFNAAVVQIPKLGLLGWYRNALLIGLPLMKALTREQLAAVLAHEFGHLAGGHGRLGNWVYRLRFGWMRLAAALQARGNPLAASCFARSSNGTRPISALYPFHLRVPMSMRPMRHRHGSPRRQRLRPL
jgi:Zn-dependent protease with chaperone function